MECPARAREEEEEEGGKGRERKGREGESGEKNPSSCPVFWSRVPSFEAAKADRLEVENEERSARHARHGGAN